MLHDTGGDAKSIMDLFAKANAAEGIGEKDINISFVGGAIKYDKDYNDYTLKRESMLIDEASRRFGKVSAALRLNSIEHNKNDEEILPYRQVNTLLTKDGIFFSREGIEINPVPSKFVGFSFANIVSN